jgi:azurin
MSTTGNHHDLNAAHAGPTTGPRVDVTAGHHHRTGRELNAPTPQGESTMRAHRSAAFLSLALLASPGAFAACEVRIESGDSLMYNKDELKVDSSCDTITVTLAHTGNLPANAMGHNWVLTAEGDAKAVSKAGSGAGIDNDYLPQDDERVIAATDLIGGGETSSVSIPMSELDASGSYVFLCTFPGHYPAMKGTFTIM